MNFQAVSVAEKLKHSPMRLIGPGAQGNYTEDAPVPGGYVTVDGQQVPGPLLSSALGLRQQRAAGDGRHDPGQRRGRLYRDHLTAKHGQSPLNDDQLQHRPGGELRRPDHHRPALRPAEDLRRRAVGTVLRRAVLRPSPNTVATTPATGTTQVAPTILKM